MPPYTYYPTKNFIIRLKKIKLRDPQGHSRIHEVIVRLLENPDAADGRMHGIHHSRFKKYVGAVNTGSFTITVNYAASRTKSWKKNAATAR